MFSQALLDSASTWTPIDALQLHASMWAGEVDPVLDCHMLPLAGTRRENINGIIDIPSPTSTISPLASTSGTLAIAAASEFSRENTRADHLSDVHFHSPWALGGVSRLQCYIHTLTCSIVTAQTAMRQLMKEVEGHAAATRELIAADDQDILHVHRVESGDAAMVPAHFDARQIICRNANRFLSFRQFIQRPPRRYGVFELTMRAVF